MSVSALTRDTTPAITASSESRRSTERFRLVLISLSLVLAVFAQSAGNAAADTKIDLVISPLRFLGRALRLWDPTGGAGQLQNQSYGYLFPIGPFFAALHALGFPPWEVQRAWESAILVAAFLGAYRVARRLGVRSFWPAAAAGLTYALAPRTLGELTSISSELMPVAALPWVLLPLIGAAGSGSPRRAAARSGVALLFAGGVNAAATLAILPAPVLYLLTRSRGPRRRALIGWWAGAVVLACLWWAVPLVQLGRYSPPFLDWIESSSTTTLPTSLLASLRGVDHWESYLGPNIWPAGWIFASAPVAVVATTAVAAAGVVGMARRDVPERVFLWATLLLGLALLTFGHVSDVAVPGVESMRRLLDGPLVAFRNVHKFDPLVRLPLAIGVGFLLDRVRVPVVVRVGRSSAGISVPARALSAVAAIAVGLIAVSPVLTNHLVSSQRVTAEPGWWRAAAQWLGAHSEGARALVVPGSASPHYVWGGTVDNALQPVATTPWTERNAVPLTQAGYIRLLDDVESKLSAGPTPHLRRYSPEPASATSSLRTTSIR
jgi:arabinofuranan 3-O-arabinosyltransferase